MFLFFYPACTLWYPSPLIFYQGGGEAEAGVSWVSGTQEFLWGIKFLWASAYFVRVCQALLIGRKSQLIWAKGGPLA